MEFCLNRGVVFLLYIFTQLKQKTIIVNKYQCMWDPSKTRHEQKVKNGN